MFTLDGSLAHTLALIYMSTYTAHMDRRVSPAQARGELAQEYVGAVKEVKNGSMVWARLCRVEIPRRLRNPRIGLKVGPQSQPSVYPANARNFPGFRTLRLLPSFSAPT